MSGSLRWWLGGSAPPLLEELIEKHEAQLPLADLLYADIAKSFKESIISAEYLGIKLVNGVKCHHLSFESTGADWQIWVQDSSLSIASASFVTSPSLFTFRRLGAPADHA